MEINPDIIKKNPDIVQTIKRVRTSVFFFSVCLLIMDTRYYSGTCILNYYCLQLDHENLIVFTRWSRSTLFSGPLSKMRGVFFVCFAYFRKKWSAKGMKKIVSWSWLVSFLENWRKSLWFVKSTYFLSQAIQNQIFICQWLSLMTCFETDHWIGDVLVAVAVVDAKAHYYLRYLVIGQEQNFVGANWHGPAVSIRNVSQSHRRTFLSG